VPVWLPFVFLGLGFMTLKVLVSGPKPRRANGWAWFWMMLFSPLGIALYLVFGGPLGRREPPRNRNEYMTGGWGFLAALILGALWSWASR
jgi:drug/metabolite transporter (DMT)-like permease